MIYKKKNNLIFPSGKRFAFSVLDDTDVATLDYIKPMYDYMHELGIFSTKTVWGVDYHGESSFQGTDTLQNKEYADYIKVLKDRGFEIAYHGATMETASINKIKNSLEVYYEVLGEYPNIYAAHSLNQDNLYWGEDRFAFKLTRRLYQLLSSEKAAYYQGHIEGSPHFWGDIAKQHLEFARSFTFSNPNLLTLNLPLVYQNHKTPWIKKWFLTCDADNVEEFNALISSSNQEKLEEEGGLCIISTHFGKGFIDNGEVHPETKHLLDELRRRDCWFAPVSEILNHYVREIGCSYISNSKLLKLEIRWFLDSLKRRRMKKEYNSTEINYLKSNLMKKSSRI